MRLTSDQRQIARRNSVRSNLVLTRYPGQSIQLDVVTGDKIIPIDVTIVSVKGNNVKVAISSSPDEVAIVRSELS